MALVVYALDAEKDLVEIASYIANDNVHAARNWVQSIRETCDLLATHPETGELRSDFDVPDCRCFSMGNYVIFFRPTSEGIEVARIIHGNRDLRNL